MRFDRPMIDPAGKRIVNDGCRPPRRRERPLPSGGSRNSLALESALCAAIGHDCPMSDCVSRLYEAVLARRGLEPTSSRTAKLFAAGRNKVAQKVGEEAVEVALDAVRNDRGGVIGESADLVYHLVVLWAEMGIVPAEVWAEMTRREAAQGIAEKIPKAAA